MGNYVKGSPENTMMLFIIFISIVYALIISVLNTLFIDGTLGNALREKINKIEQNQNQIILLLSKDYPEFELVYPNKKPKHKKGKDN